MVLEAGQKDTGGVGRASGHLAADATLNDSAGGSAGLNRMVSAATTDFTDSPDTGHSPDCPRCRATGRSPRRPLTSAVSMRLHSDGPSANPNWNAEMRSNAEPCSPPSPEHEQGDVAKRCVTGCEIAYDDWTGAGSRAETFRVRMYSHSSTAANPAIPMISAGVPSFPGKIANGSSLPVPATKPANTTP